MKESCRINYVFMFMINVVKDPKLLIVFYVGEQVPRLFSVFYKYL